MEPVLEPLKHLSNALALKALQQWLSVLEQLCRIWQNSFLKIHEYFV